MIDATSLEHIASYCEGMDNGSLGNDNSPLTTPSNEVQQIAFDTTNVVVFAAALVSGGKAILGRMPVTVFRVEGLPKVLST